MNKYIKTTEFLSKPVVSKPLNSLAFDGNQLIISYNKSCFDEKAKNGVNLKPSVSHHDKSYDYKSDNIYRQKPKNN